MSEFVMGARLTMRDEFTDQLRDVIRATQMFTQGAQQADQATDYWRDSNGRLRDSMGRFVAEVRQSSAQLDRHEAELEQNAAAASGLRDRLGAVTSALASLAAAGASMAVGYKWLIDSNAAMEQYQNTLTVVLGSQEKAVQTLEWANKFAAQTPFEIPQIVEATTRMSAYGIEAQKTLGIVGDMASVMGKDLMQAVEAVADAQTGELERLKEFGITKKMLEDQAKLMGKTPFDNKGSLTDAKALNDALFALMEKRFKGGMEMQSKSFKGMLSNVSDFMGTMGRELGKPLFDKAKENLQTFLNWLNQLKDSGAIDAFIKNVQRVGKVFRDTFFYVYSWIVTIAETVQPVLQPVFDWLTGTGLPAVSAGIQKVWQYAKDFAEMIDANWSTIAPFIQGITIALTAYAAIMGVVRVATMAWAAAQAVVNAVMAINPITLIILGIGLLVGAIIYAMGGFDNFKAKMAEIWAFLVKAWQGIWTTVQPILAQLWTTIVATWNSIVAAVMPVVTNIWNGIRNVFTAIYNFIVAWWPLISAVFQIAFAWWQSIFKSALQIIWTIVQGAFNFILAIIKGVWNVVTGVIQVGWSVISGIFSVALNLLSGNWQAAWDAMLDMLTGVWDGIKNFFTGLKNLFWDSGRAIITTLADGIKSMVSAPIDAIKSVLEKVREYLPFSDAKRGPLSELTYSGGAIMTTLATGVDKQSGAVSEAMSNAFSTAPTLNPAANMQPITATMNIAAQTPALAATMDVAANYEQPDAFSDAYTVRAQGVNPAGNVQKNVSKSTTIDKLVEKIELHAAPGVDVDALIDEFIDKLHERLEGADDVLGTADMGALL